MCKICLCRYLKLKLIHWETLKVLFPCSTQNKAHLVMFRIIWYSLVKQKKRIQNTFNQRSPYKKKIIRILKDHRTMNLSNPQRLKPKVTSSIHKRQVTTVCPIQRTYSCSGYLGSSDIGQSKRIQIHKWKTWPSTRAPGVHRTSPSFQDSLRV